MPSSSRHWLPMHSGHMRPGIVLHYEESRAHCTSIRSDNGSEDLIPVPKSSKGALTRWGLCDPPRIFHPRPSLTHSQTSHAGWCFRPLNIPKGISRLSHVLTVKRTGRRWGSCQFWCSLVNANPAARCWAVSTGPTTGHRAFMPPSWTLIQTIWSKTFTLLEAIL